MLLAAAPCSDADRSVVTATSVEPLMRSCRTSRHQVAAKPGVQKLSLKSLAMLLIGLAADAVAATASSSATDALTRNNRWKLLREVLRFALIRAGAVSIRRAVRRR